VWQNSGGRHHLSEQSFETSDSARDARVRESLGHNDSSVATTSI
jgi:hypothetical protein